ncbi:TetR/AcrR family transcriptional regulator [Sphingomonas sp. C3-2]|uniref:TetR/AcrR family transcriptional regulator n=1 Tax=Sphingomonas sp. C3-2 TaxID=3062169 RepID=UPI00294B8464|nr:TetR/AcrR family transcriptional regulator [Sphingomonas sp. C3-2]WOK37957.1 TetR/AcrR family transcriptional regulator [Sphingomonas sp. C3-2]
MGAHDFLPVRMPELKMPKKRLSHSERNRVIVAAAADVFAEHGFERATTKQIADAARVSPALLYEHFPSKEALFRAVLRKLIRDQDRMTEALAVRSPELSADIDGATALVLLFHSYFSGCVLARHHGQDVNAHRILFSSIAGDGSYARLMYRRGLRVNGRALEQALEEARASGALRGEPISVQEVYCFTEHMGSMMLSSHLADPPLSPYSETGQTLVRKAVFFCGRGIGLSDDLIRQVLDRIEG